MSKHDFNYQQRVVEDKEKFDSEYKKWLERVREEKSSDEKKQ